MKSTSFKKKSLSPLISTILLVVVAVILVTLVLTWGKETTTSNLERTTNFGDLKASDATYFIHSKTIKNGTLQFNYLPPENLLNEKLTITSYTVLEIPEIQEPILLKEQKELVPGINLIELTGLYAYSTTAPDLTIQLITSNNTFLNFNVTEPGMVCVKTDEEDGSEENPYLICTAEDLNDVREHLDWNYTLGKDIDLYYFSRKDENGWEPIGTKLSGFSGIFDGQNHIINNLYLNRPVLEYVGLFSNLNYTATLKNIGLNNVDILAKSHVGGLVGVSKNDYEINEFSKIINCFVTGKLIAVLNDSGHANIGGLIGVNYGYINNCYFIGDVLAEHKGMVGGLVGNNIYSSIINSFAKANVYSPNVYVGGFIGGNDRVIEIRNCYSDGNVVGETNSVGGFIGATLVDTDTFDLSQGVHNCYSKSIVINNYGTGGFNGNNINNSETFFNVFWDINISGQENSEGGMGKSTTDMKNKNNFLNWDFTTIWDISPTINNGYPYLRNNLPPN